MRKNKRDFQKKWRDSNRHLSGCGGHNWAVIGVITNALKKLGKGLANGLKSIGAKAASALPGLIGVIASFLLKAAVSVIGFLEEHTWLLMLAVVTFLFQKLMNRRR